ncbi:DUF305 domain-containing protein [Actinoplanes sp. NBRC 14428]|uniref:Uncharacterized protein (DUF305 family) n=1 Tax=Pseudosporangium ferrugineum TaxID=439699 RepID=A0A2T0SIZ2_9ACTN|nr:DUF305 domain-containing protein [Pseudosporangium ferrugineum]PRY33378.1 uncharacterized protein (DUF305 family) [Pseudosporangium ferrugineum]BCJ48622.1 DUF305 domain-containing protein [Actinoplanes sp. NBRC 14428]
MPVRRLAAALVLAATALTVVTFAARGGGDGDPPDQPQRRPVAVASVTPPAPADLRYAREMVAHHEQAVRMSRSMLAKPGLPERIRDLAGFIAQDQQREIDETNAWLTAWGEQSAAGHEHGHGAGAGMLTPAQLTSIDAAAGGTAVRLYLTGMIEHHRGAVTMSRELLDGGGRNVYIHGLAKHVINEQTTEIDAMTGMLPAGTVSGAAGA